MCSDSTQGPSDNIIDWYGGPKNGGLVDRMTTEVTLKASPRHYSVLAIPEILTIQGPNRPPINQQSIGK